MDKKVLKNLFLETRSNSSFKKTHDTKLKIATLFQKDKLYSKHIAMRTCNLKIAMRLLLIIQKLGLFLFAV